MIIDNVLDQYQIWFSSTLVIQSLHFNICYYMHKKKAGQIQSNETSGQISWGMEYYDEICGQISWTWSILMRMWPYMSGHGILWRKWQPISWSMVYAVGKVAIFPGAFAYFDEKGSQILRDMIYCDEKGIQISWNMFYFDQKCSQISWNIAYYDENGSQVSQGNEKGS